MKLRWLSAAAVGAALVVAVGIATRRSETPAGREPTAASSDVARDDGCAFEAGQRFAFDARAEVTLVMHPAALGAPNEHDQTVSSAASATLEARVLAVTGAGEAIVALAARGWQDEPAAIAETGATWADELARPILVRLDGRCRVLASGRHRDGSVLAFDRVRRLIEPLDVAVVTGVERAYETRQADTYGTSVWSNRWRAGEGRGQITRERTRFADTTRAAEGLDGAALRFSIRASRGTIALGAGPWIASLDQRETILTANRGATALESTSHSQFSARTPARDAFAGADLALDHYLWSTSAQDVAAAKDDGAALRGVPLDDAWGAYQAQAASDWFAAQALLRAWIRANPEALGALGQALRDGRYTEAEQAALVLALAKSGSAAARKLLEQVAADGALKENLRTQAVSALGDAMPDAETFTTLTRLADRVGGSSTQDLVGSAATMTLGTLIDQHPGVSDAARAYLEQRLAATDSKGVTEALWAVGNSGDAGFMDVVTPLATSPDADVRAAAAHALRRMPSREAAPLLAERMKAEAHPEVAAEIAAARREQLGRDGRLSETELNLYRSKLIDAPEPLRRELVLALGAASKHQPEARQVLVDWFPNETSLAVKQLIGQYVPASLL